jgi:release factor glutamine methyltransferase
MTVRKALAFAAASLAPITDTPRLDAELLMAHALDVERSVMLLKHLDDPEPAAFAALLARRTAHEPIAYITGVRDFWTITLHVAPGVLIPRPDSETLIEAALAHFNKAAPRSILDLGTGSGALLLAALSHWPKAHGVGVDVSEPALTIATRNARDLGLAGRARFQPGDWAAAINEQFDLILCNPPYVESKAALSREVADHEPPGALFAGSEGLDDYRRLGPQIARLIAPGGVAVIEIGYKQADTVSVIFGAFALNVAVRCDLGDRDRCLILTKNR